MSTRSIKWSCFSHSPLASISSLLSLVIIPTNAHLDCITCRSRKVKCDERRPTCSNCEKVRVECIPADSLCFRPWSPPSPSGSDCFWLPIAPDCTFVDETDVIAAEYGHGKDPDSGPQTPSSPLPVHADAGARALLSMRDEGARAEQDLPPPSPSSDLSESPPALIFPAITSEEARLLRLFSAEVGQWMDLSDLSQTFSRKICHLAVHDPLLKAATIACAAKQQYLTGHLHDGMLLARRNYNTAISLLIDRLGESAQPYAGFGFAATVICSCYEMLDATGSDWQKHLDGVFSFSRVRSVNGSSGGIEQAGFWSIARQEVVCSIINKSKVRLDPDLWALDLEQIGQEGCEDLVNNQVLTILAKVANTIAHWEVDPPRKPRAVEEWKRVWGLLDHWERSMTGKGFMDPVVYQEEGQVFPTIWFTQGVCASSWQMFHLARILLLGIDPSQDMNCTVAFRNIEGKLQYHAEQICGIAQSKPEGSCRVNSVQALYYAGCCFSNPVARKAVCVLLESIEDDLGWAAKYRAKDLQKSGL